MLGLHFKHSILIVFLVVLVQMETLLLHYVCVTWHMGMNVLYKYQSGFIFLNWFSVWTNPLSLTIRCQPLNRNVTVLCVLFSNAKDEWCCVMAPIHLSKGAIVAACAKVHMSLEALLTPMPRRLGWGGGGHKGRRAVKNTKQIAETHVKAICAEDCEGANGAWELRNP